MNFNNFSWYIFKTF